MDRWPNRPRRDRLSFHDGSSGVESADKETGHDHPEAAERARLRQRRGPATPSREKLNGRLLLANLVLGVAVLLASGYAAALAGGA